MPKLAALPLDSLRQSQYYLLYQINLNVQEGQTVAADELPEVYSLESIDQMRAMADNLRLRILQLLALTAMTVTELGKQLGVPANKTHYHVRELERVGLLRLVETREKSGILEKYYRAVARDFTIPTSLLQGTAADEGLALIDEFAHTMLGGLQRAARIAVHQPEETRDTLSLGASYLWLTRDEFREVNKGIASLLEPYAHPRDIPGAREHTFALIAYVTPPLTKETAESSALARPPDSAASSAPGSAAPTPKRRRVTVSAGAISFARADLERIAAANERLDLYVLGVCSFADDIPADLVDRAIGRFRHRGKLIASAAVRDILLRSEKGKES